MPGALEFSSPEQLRYSVPESSIHSGIQPAVHFFQKQSPVTFEKTDSIHRWLRRTFFNNNFILVRDQSTGFNLKINPLVNLQSGTDRDDGKRYYTNTRGVWAAGSVGRSFYFETLFAESQSTFPGYISAEANATQVVPGQGRWKNFKTNGFDYAFSSGLVSVQLNKHLNLQVGHGKQKIGYGYRSLLLSDNAFNYPFLRLTQQWMNGRLQYTNLYAVLMNLTAASTRPNPNTEILFQKKCASFQYLSFNASSRINIGLFQSLVWQPGDNRNRQQLDFRYFNPLIYSNLPSLGLDDKNNINIGADLRIKLTKSINLYGQYMLDRVRTSAKSRDHFGWMAGVHYYLGRSAHLLHLQAEYCDLPFAQGNYDHYNQSLSYTPLQGREISIIADYHYRRLFLFIKQQQQVHLQGTAGQNSIQLTECRAGVLLNRNYNMNLCVGALVRTQNFNNFKTLNSGTNYLYLAFRTSIYNLYYDF